MVRSSLGRAVLADSGGLAEEYPYYEHLRAGFPRPHEWLPHEALKASGKSKQMGETDEVIFVSHQWTSLAPRSRRQPAARSGCRSGRHEGAAARSDVRADGGWAAAPAVTAGKE